MTLTGHSWFFLSWPLVAFKETHETMKTFVLKKIKARDSGYYRITKIFLKNFFVARNHLSSLAKFT